MAHKQQIEFCSSIKRRFPELFSNKFVLDVGSFDVNGNNSYLFQDCLCLGIDVAIGRNVDICTKGHELALPDASVDVVVSTECFEHDQYYELTLNNIARMLKPGGLFLFTCATTGRTEHGTRRTRPQDAPLIQELGEWGDYYKNLEEQDIRRAIDVAAIFKDFEFSLNDENHDLYFWGVKHGDLTPRQDYSFQVNRPPLHAEIKEREGVILILQDNLNDRGKQIDSLQQSLLVAEQGLRNIEQSWVERAAEQQKSLARERESLQSQIDSLQQVLQVAEEEKLQQWMASTEQERAASQAHAERERELQERLLAAEQELRSVEQSWAKRAAAQERQLVQEKSVLQSQIDSLQQVLQVAEEEKLQQWMASTEQERAASQAHAERERELQERLLAAEQELRSVEQHWVEKYKEQNDVLLNFQQTSANLQNHLQEQLRTTKHISQQWQQASIALQNELVAIKGSLAWRLASPLRELGRWSGLTSISVSTAPILSSDPTNGNALSPQQLLLGSEYHQPSFNEGMIKNDKITEAPYTLPNYQTSQINSVNDLLALHDEDFVRAAYRVVLGRTPESEGFKHYLGRMRGGIGKLEILAQLRASQEGQKHDVKLAGLDEALRLDRWQRLPYIGPVLGWLKGESDKRLRGIENQLYILHRARARRFDQLDRTLGGIQRQIEQLVEVENEQNALPLTIDKPRFHPVNEIFLDTSKGIFWESQGEDPYFFLEINHALLARSGWGALDLAIHSERKKGVAKFYLDMGDGYNEAETLVVPYNSDEPSERIFQIGKPILGIRFDPQEGKGRFRIDALQFRAITEADAISAMAGRLAELHESFEGKNAKEIMRFVEEMKSERNDSPPQRMANLYSTTFISSQSSIAYVEWIERIERPSLPTAEDVAASLASLAMQPLISVVMPTYNTPEVFLRSCIESVINQSYQNWELCIADDASTNPEVRSVLDQYLGRDARIHVVYRPQNGHISAASNSALEIAQGDYVALLDHDDALPEHALYYMVLAINQHPSAKVLYSDEDKIESKGNRFDPHFKSDWNPDLFYSQNYVSHLGVYRRDLLEQIGGFRPGVEGSQDHDLLLRCLPYVAHGEIIHIPRILYHWRAVEGSTAMEAGEKSYTTEAGIKALGDYFKAHGPSNISVEQGLVSNTYRLRWPIPEPAPLVSLLIPTRDKRELIETCVSSILDKSTYTNYEILILDNGSIEPDTLTFFKQIQGEDARVKVLRYDYPFNYPAINNFGVKHAKGEIIGLVNNDIEVIGSEWLAEMVSHACRPEIGCVGGKLYYGNDTLQHAGVICGLGDVAGHSHKYFPRIAPGYFSRLILTQTLSAVTAACLLVRREVYEEVGGLDEKNLTVAFNDVDFCLKVRAAGYRNLWTPYAELYHHESISRGTEDTPEKQARFQKEVEFMKNKWGDKLAADPYYSPNLTRDREDFSIGINFV